MDTNLNTDGLLKKIKLKINSINGKLWISFVGFTLLIMIIVWLLQIALLNFSYSAMQLNEIKSNLDGVICEFGKENFEDKVYNLALNRNLNIAVLDEYGNNYFKDWEGRSFFFIRKKDRDIFPVLRSKLMEKGKGEAVFTIKDVNDGHKTLVYGVLLKDKGDITNVAYIFVAAHIAELDITAVVLQKQLLIALIAGLFLATIISYFVANILAKPIKSITESANILAKGNYDVVFDEGGYEEISQLSSSLNYATKELSKVDSTKNELLANISHDLKTPLTMIKAYAEMIRDLSGDNKEKRTEHLDIIIEETDRLNYLVEDMLDLSKIQDASQTINESKFNVFESIRTILLRFSYLTETEGYKFIYKGEKDLFVLGSETQIYQVIYNLISNAINHSTYKKEITVNAVALSNGKILIEIFDKGEGIEQDEIDKIWTRYYKGKQVSHKRAKVGSGLGLSIVKGILDKHGYDYGVGSEIGKGTCFWFEVKKA